MLKLPKIITKTLSIRLSLLATGGIALLLVSSLAVMYHLSRHAMRDKAMHNAEQTLEGTVQHIDNILLSVEQSTGNIYWDMLAHIDQPEQMYTYARRLVECNSYIVGCAIVFKPYFYPDRELFMAYVHRKGNSVTETEDSELVVSETFGSRPYTEQIWFTEPMATGHACWVGPLKGDDTEDEALTTFCLPIYDKTWQCVGVVGVDLPIDLLSQIILAAKPSENGYSTLLGRDGSFIVHPDEEKRLHQTVFTQTEHGADPSVKEVAKAMVAGKTGFEAFRMDGRNWFVAFKPFHRVEVPGRSMEELGWSVGVVYPEGDIFGDYNRLILYVLAIAVGGLLLFFVLCRFVTHRQLQPLRLLTQSAQRIAEGNYGETIPHTHRKDEIGQLQDHFQKMQKALAKHSSELQQLTKTLDERRDILRKAYRQAQEADRMKTAFLHNMTNQMIKPSDAIVNSVTALCTLSHPTTSTIQQADHEVGIIQQQGHVIIDLLDHLIHVAENETGKEAADDE